MNSSLRLDSFRLINIRGSLIRVITPVTADLMPFIGTIIVKAFQLNVVAKISVRIALIADIRSASDDY